MNSLEGVMVIGLTGQTGAGKSTVSAVFVKDGFHLIDADAVAREVVKAGRPCLEELQESFSENILTPEGELDRKKMADIVFSNARKKEILNAVMYPYIMGEILRRIRALSLEGHKLLLLDAPTLFESRADDFCELVISVVAKPEIRKQRIIERDCLSESAAVQRMEAQLSEQFFREHSDTVLENNGDLESLILASEELADKMQLYYRRHYAPLASETRESEEKKSGKFDRGGKTEKRSVF